MMWPVIGLCLVCAFLLRPSTSRRRGNRDHLFVGTGSHWRRNYSRRSFLRLAAGIVGAGLLAYSGADEAVESYHAGQIRSRGTDGVSHFFKFFGERFWFLNWLLVGVVDAWFQTNPFTRWGRKNFEAMVVGLPTLWTVQRGLGANRPSSADGSPRWRPMNADNSASGHTFMAAVPWLTLARRVRGKPLPQVAVGASFLTGWSRLNDRKHYVSQIMLGWIIAWNAVGAVDDGEGKAQSPTGEITGAADGEQED
jgi:membrane-associated phospholipid phosphatase